ncbi:MAG: hypothetical protein AAFO57_10030 [Pseudomonadota bacterium]
MRSIVLILSLLGLAACGQQAAETEATPAPEMETETASSGDADASTPAGSLPPAPTFAEDGDTFRAATGEEISVKLELPDQVGTNHAWQLQDNAWPDHLSWGNTWTSFEGALRYNDVIINADAAGESDLTFIRYADGQPTEEQVTVTVIVD